MTFSKTACHAATLQAATGARYISECFPTNANNSVAFVAWQVAYNLFPTYCLNPIPRLNY